LSVGCFGFSYHFSFFFITKTANKQKIIKKVKRYSRMKELKRKNVQSGIIEAVATTCFSVKEKSGFAESHACAGHSASYLYEKRFELKLLARWALLAGTCLFAYCVFSCRFLFGLLLRKVEKVE